MRTSSVLIAILGWASMVAAEPTQPDAFLPWALPAWEALPQQTLVVKSVLAGFPGERAGLRQDDCVLSLAGVPVYAVGDLDLARWLASTTGQWALSCSRAGNPVTISAAGMAMNQTRFGFGIADVETSVLLPLRAADAALLRSEMPIRAQLEAKLWADAHPGEMTWWTGLQDDLVAAVNSRVPGPAVEQPTPFLRGLSGCYRRAATAYAAGTIPELSSDLQEAWFAARFQPIPTDMAKLDVGTITAGGADIAAALLAMAQTGQRNSEVANSLADHGGEDWQSYRHQVLAAVLDEDRHGGWPFRSAHIWERGARRHIVEALRKDATQAGSDRQLDALARIAPAVMDQDWAALRHAMSVLSGTSPWLANQGWIIAKGAANMHNLTPALQAQSAQRPFPGMPTRSPIADAWCARLGVTEQMDAATCAVWLRNDIPAALATTWQNGAAWRSVWQERSELIQPLNNLAWDVATDPVQLDPSCVAAVARQLELVCANEMPVFVGDTMAACMARAGDMKAAQRWQEQAVRMIGEEETDGYRDRLGSFQAGKVWTEPGQPGAMGERTVGAMQWKGIMRAGGQWGVWIATDESGRERERIGYRNGQPHGRWVVTNAAGVQEVEGLFVNRERMGWWRERLADGSTAEGWYRPTRTGWWRIRSPQGVILREGAFSGGSPVISTWRRCDAAGLWTACPADAIALPEPRPVPEVGVIGAPPAAPGEEPTQPLTF